MKDQCRWAILCALVTAVAVTGPSIGAAARAPSREPAASTAAWQQRVQRFDELWNGGQRPQAEREILADGRETAAAGLRRVVQELPRSDPRRTQAGFALYVLDLDRELGRSVLVAACRPGSRPDPFDYAFAGAIGAYDSRPDRQLLAAVLELAPHSDGASTDGVLWFVAKAAVEHTRDLLLVLREKSVQVRRSVAVYLTPNLKGRPARQAYPELARIAGRATDSLHSDAQRLLRSVDEEAKRQQSIQNQTRREEARRSPIVPKGVTLPVSAVKALQSSYPGWHIMGTSGFAPEVVASVQKHFGRAATPQHCSGDFDGNGLRDEALLIREDGGEGVRFIVLRQVKAGRWKADDLVSSDLSGGIQGGHSGFSIYITPRAPGTIAYWTEQGPTGRLDLKHDGVEWIFYGKAGMLYYWTGRDWDKVQTGD